MKYRDSGNLPREGLIDFRVQALIGYPIVHHTSDHLDLYNMWASFSFNGTASDWSNTLTLRMSDGTVTQSSSSSSPTTEPDQIAEPSPTNYTGVHLKEQVIIGVAVAVAVIGAGLGLLVYAIKCKRGAEQS